MDRHSYFPGKPRTGPWILCPWILILLVLIRRAGVYAKTESIPLPHTPGGQGPSPWLWLYIHPVPDSQGVGGELH